MSIFSEFQEREYESLFIQELAKLGCFTWTPGQTDEFYLGFDGGSWVNPLMLLNLGFVAPRPAPRMLRWWPFWEPEYWKGVRLTPELVRDWQRFADDYFPPKLLNFFVQHKRPKQTTKQGAAGAHWKQAYFEFPIDKQQQSRLEALEDKLGDQGVVTYASAAFLKKKDLWDCQNQGTIISSSNFVSSLKLKGHSRYTYIEPGHLGFANEEPTPIEGVPIITRLRSAYERSEGGYSTQIKLAGNLIDEVMSEDEDKGVSLYYELLGRLRETIDRSRDDKGLLDSIFKISAFNTANNTSWILVSNPESV